MKQLKNFLIKREQSQACLSFAKREKSRLLAKTLLTLVALLAVTGAWADETLLLTIESKDYTSFTSGSKTFDDMVTITFSNPVSNDGNTNGWYAASTASLLTVAGTNGYTITSCKFYTAYGDAETGYTVQGESPSVYLHYKVVYTDNSESVNIGYYGVTKIEVYGTAPAASSSSGPEVAWDKAAKTGTFTMPGGNVTLEPEYYPQAVLTEAPTAADGAKATTDDLLVSGGTVATITGSDPAAPQGTLMYYVSLTTMTTEALLALDADKWVAEPTAAGITQKCGAFVYYYVKGNDSTDDALNFSDGDISSANVLNVPIYPAPLWNAEFDLTNAPEADKADGIWKTDITGDGVVKGTPVTVTYSGDRKVIGVKAEKKAAAPAETTVTLTPGEIGDLESSSKTINGITIEVSGDAQFFTTGLMDVIAFDGETGEPCPGAGTFTFTSSVGKIKRIDINHNGGNWWGSGAGWPGSYQVYHSSTFTWSGTPAASVTLNGSCNDMDNCTFDVSSIVLTLEPTN